MIVRGVPSKVRGVAFNDKIDRPSAASFGLGRCRCDSPVDRSGVVDRTAMLRYQGAFGRNVTHGTGGEGRDGGKCEAAPHSGFSTGLCFTTLDMGSCYRCNAKVRNGSITAGPVRVESGRLKL